MTLLDEFEPDDRRILVTALEAVAVLVSTASPGRKEETASEGIAMAEFIVDSARRNVAHPLLASISQVLEDRVAAGGSFPEYTKVVAEPDARSRADGLVRSAVALVDARATPDEARAYKEWLLAIATTVAAAGKEDQGFLGSGGVLVNEAERAAVRDIAAVLSLPAPEI